MNAKEKSKQRKRKIENIMPASIKCLKLDRDFFNVSCIDLAKALLGKILVRNDNNRVLKGQIVETECYLGGVDKASRSYNGRRTEACEPMYMQPGTAFIYMTYGMYYCFNISSQEPGAAVLLRALEPLEGKGQMGIFRAAKKKKGLKEHELCNGPSKLCMSMNISKNNNKLDLCTSEEMWIENESEKQSYQIVTTSRIGIDSAGEEWAKKPLRFYINKNIHVSKRDKTAESLLDN